MEEIRRGERKEGEREVRKLNALVVNRPTSSIFATDLGPNYDPSTRVTKKGDIRKQYYNSICDK